MVRLVLDVVAAFHAILSGKISDFKAICQAHTHFWSTLKSTLKKRKTLKNQQRADGSYHIDIPIKTNAIIYEYFIKGKTTYSQIFSDQESVGHRKS